LCYETQDIEKALEESVARDRTILREPTPAVAFGGRRIAVVYLLELGLIEFVEAPDAVSSGTALSRVSRERFYDEGDHHARTRKKPQ
jgi:hypothetical protein